MVHPLVIEEVMDSNLDLIQILVITEDIKITDVRNNLRNKNSGEPYVLKQATSTYF